MADGANVYAANLAAFRERYGVVADYVDKLDTRAYQICAAESGEPYLRVKLAGGREVTVDDASDPRRAARALLPEPHDRPVLFVVMGMGLGYLLLEARQAFPNARFLVIEPEPFVFKMAMSTFDLTPILKDPTCAFDVALDLGLLPRFFINYFSQRDAHMYLPTVDVLRNPSIVKLTPDYYNKAGTLFSHAVKDFWSHGTGNTYTDALIGLRYVLENLSLHERMHAFDAYANLCRGRVGIVVASGPSLDTKIERLREIQDRAVIICADSALEKLLKCGIKPFGVACLERDDVNAELFEGYDIPEDVALFAPPLVKPSLTQTYPGPIVTMFRHSYPFSWLPELLPLWDIGSSCAHLAFQALRVLGCRQIALIGQDLAYDRRTGTSHYAGVTPVATNQFGAMNRITAPDHDGGTIETTAVWVMFRNIFSDLIAVNRVSHVSNVIEKDRGLDIPGAPRAEPEEFFRSLAGEPKGLPVLEREPGRRPFHEKIANFTAELTALIALSETQLDQVRDEIAAFAVCRDVREYLAARERVYGALDPRVRDLLDELWRPHQRRFEAAAFALWDGTEFARQIPEYAALAVKICDELREVLRACPYTKKI